MSEAENSISPTPHDVSLEEISGWGIAHVHIEGEITFTSTENQGRNQTVWSWSKQSIVLGHDVETGAFWQVLRFFIEDRGYTKEEMLDWLDDTARSLRQEIARDRKDRDEASD